ncbi:hypothetical protein GYMLUDRAFT_936945 [Collybiopsis luxurians FD-317 M1]|uniref:Unplaced genomic scaffold GYMLUscaffold_81, whole genome shotgun sequence n=1 Tax=Collybiopsis luxurians FD-317 M1 TaxID=944289 RepID=A0A0D0C6G7_9AGAR|nr:hypothetical protein GYMLUDRAFT_936945 [Collybiopsis luxurians FD-317 M1]
MVDQKKAQVQALGDPASAGASFSAAGEMESKAQPKSVRHSETNAAQSNGSANDLNQYKATANVNDKSKTPPVPDLKAVFQTWKTVHKLTGAIQPFLQFTPFHGLIFIFNVMSSAAEEEIEKLLRDIKNYFQILNEALLKGIEVDQITNSATALVQKAKVLNEMQYRSNIKEGSTTTEIKAQLEGMTDDMNMERDKLQVCLVWLISYLI